MRAATRAGQGEMDGTSLVAAAQQQLRECDKYALFDASGKLLASNYQVSMRTSLARWHTWVPGDSDAAPPRH